MGAVRFSIDSGLVRELRRVLPLEVFVESGTYEGASAREMMSLFDELHTIELSAPLYAHAVEEFGQRPNVQVHHGRSEQVLKELAPALRRRSVLYWLDAHWCDEKSAGEDAQCPVLEELEAIGSVDGRSVVLIDDARLFMAPPPKPAVIEGWPRFSEVLDGLSALNAEHELLVIDDVLVFFPPSVRELLRDYAHQHAVDWLSELQMSQRVQLGLDRLRAEVANLRSKTAEQARKRAERVGRHLNELKAAIAALEEEVRELGQRFQEPQSSLDERLGPVTADLVSTGAQLAATVAQLELTLKALDEGGEQSLEPQLDSVFQALRGLRGRFQQINKRIEPLGAELAALRQRSDETLNALRELPKAQRELTALGTRVDTLGRELGQLRPRFDRRSEATLEQLRAMRHQMRGLQDRLDEQERPLHQTRRFVQAVGTKLYGPRLGSLDHHAPRELRVPKRYRREPAPPQPPRISIVTPAGTQPAFLDRTIRSVLDQGYEPLEYIVENCAPSRETSAVLDRHRERLARCHESRNGKPATALNEGFGQATGEILSCVRPDALLLGGALTYVARYFERHPEVDVVYGHRVLVDAEDREIGRWVLPRHRDEVLSWIDYVPDETLFWRRRVWEAIGGEVDEDLHETFDWDLLLRFREVGARMVRVPRFLGAVRVGAQARPAGEPASNGALEVQRLRARIHGREVSEEEAQHQVRGYIRRHVILQKLYRLRLLRY